MTALLHADITAVRTCAPGHVTASVVVLSADRRSTLLTRHPRIGRWPAGSDTSARGRGV